MKLIHICTKIPRFQLERHPAVIFNLSVSGFILASMSLGDSQITMVLVFFSFMVSTALTKAGQLALNACRLTEIKALLPISFVVGFAVISLLMIALTLIFRSSALMAFVISALAVFGLSYLRPVNSRKKPLQLADTAITLIMVTAILLFSIVPISSPEILLKTGILPIWNDYFIHGVTITSFGSPFAANGNMELVGEGHTFYHYAPYMIPAAFHTISGMSGLALSTSLLLPLGLLIAALGGYVLAVELGGRLGGSFALAAIICIPAYSAFIQSGWFDFYWLLFIGPGTGYAIGVSGVVCATTIYFMKNSDKRVLLFAMLLLFSLIFIRVHMFLLLAPAITASMFIWRSPSKTPLAIGVLLCIIIFGTLALNISSDLNRLWMNFSHPHDYLNQTLKWTLFYGEHIKILNYPFLPMPAQLLLVLVAVLGVYFVLYPLFFFLNAKKFGLHPVDALPLLLILSFVALIIFAPAANNGDFTEYKHRHFPLVYVICAIYTISYACNLTTNYHSEKLKLWGYAFAVCFFSLTIVLNWNSNPSRPNVKAMPWANDFHNQAIAPGLLEAAHYIKKNAAQGDVLAMNVASLGNRLSSQIVEVISLSGVPAFVARPGLRMIGSECVRDVVINRLEVLEQLSAIDNWFDAKKFLQINGIRWFLVPAYQKNNWDPARKYRVYWNKSISVYDSGYSDGQMYEHPQC